jgi:hypothetical protein
MKKLERLIDGAGQCFPTFFLILGALDCFKEHFGGTNG